MTTYKEQTNCPKPDCGRPESTHRYSAGKRISICGNGHSWDPVELAEQRAKAKAAEHEEAGDRVKRIERDILRLRATEPLLGRMKHGEGRTQPS